METRKWLNGCDGVSGDLTWRDSAQWILKKLHRTTLEVDLVKCLPISAAVLFALAGLTLAQTQMVAAEKPTCEEWKYVNSKMLQKSGTSESAMGATGQYSSGDPFHKVVRFYVAKSGFEPPNWSILGRQFPGDKINLPGSWAAQEGQRYISLLHHIRDGSATFTVLVTDHLEQETVAVVITRGETDHETYIQIVWNRRT